MVATHIRLAPRVPDPEPEYPEGVVEAVVRVLRRARPGWAEAAGIPAERIMVDAGLDLGKTEPMSLELLRASDRLAALGYPVFLSASNKRFLGEVLGLDGRRATAGLGRPPTPSASRSAAGCCGPTTSGAAGGWPT